MEKIKKMKNIPLKKLFSGDFGWKLIFSELVLRLANEIQHYRNT